MTSTPSTILRLELLGNGDQPGTWGTTTNTNLGTLLEGAIAGWVSVSVTSANQALSIINYAPDESRRAMLTLTTTTAANFNVYAPPVSKQYTIYNNSSYTATIYNSTVAGNTTAAGTGVSIPAGKITSVWSNGTNFYKTDTALVSLTTDVSGTLPVANGGTGATTFSSGQFLKGAGTSAVTTSATVALGSEVSGTLPVANGGTGVTTSTGSGSNVLSTSPTIVNLTASQGMFQTRVAGGTGGSYTVDLNQGVYFTRTFNGNATISVSNVPAAGTVACFVFDITNAGAYTITWMTGTKWPYGIAPTLTTSGRDVLVFFTHDGGTTWNGFPSGINMS